MANNPHNRFCPTFIGSPSDEVSASREVNDRIFEGDDNGLEEAELERGVHHPSLEREVAREVEKPREEEGEIELGVRGLIGTAREPQNLFATSLPNPVNI